MEKTEKTTGRRKLMRMHWFDWVNYVLLAVLVLMMVYPMWYVLVGAFSDGLDYSYGGVWLWPRMWSLTSFKVVLLDERLWIGLRNTVGRTVLGTFLSLAFTSAVAYGMSRTDLPAKKFFQIANVFTMFFSGGFIPYYLIITLLGFYDTFWVYIITNIYSVSNMIIISTFFKNVPEELHEAALLDGASEIRIWLTIYMPLSVPILATVGLWLAVGNWNSYFNTMVFTRDSNLITLQYYLLRVIKESSMPASTAIPAAELERVTSTTVSYAAIVIATIPIVVAYPFIQKAFANGAMVGAVKG